MFSGSLVCPPRSEGRNGWAGPRPSDSEARAGGSPWPGPRVQPQLVSKFPFESAEAPPGLLGGEGPWRPGGSCQPLRAPDAWRGQSEGTVAPAGARSPQTQRTSRWDRHALRYRVKGGVFNRSNVWGRSLRGCWQKDWKLVDLKSAPKPAFSFSESLLLESACVSVSQGNRSHGTCARVPRCRDRDTDTETQRETETERHRERQRETETETETETERERQR